ncbi:unnamed protein product [Phytophthora lilii]|uniref:Unnamed protein product n=1 Tax=Phytophthora lilii TaxID=2077276 RepID=A0A9W6WV29_9STRA|nr:unnamed protein product [Phytophthora lilii]
MPTSTLGTPGASRRTQQRRLELLTPLPVVDRPLATPKRSIVASPSLESLDARRTSAKLLEQSGMARYLPPEVFGAEPIIAMLACQLAGSPSTGAATRSACSLSAMAIRASPTTIPTTRARTPARHQHFQAGSSSIGGAWKPLTAANRLATTDDASRSI